MIQTDKKLEYRRILTSNAGIEEELNKHAEKNWRPLHFISRQEAFVITFVREKQYYEVDTKKAE